MKYNLKLFTSFLLAFIIVIGLSACGTSLQKPSGLEKSEGQNTETIDDKEGKENAAEGTLKDESKEADWYLSKKEVEENKSKKDSNEETDELKKEDKKLASAKTEDEKETKKEKENIKETNKNNEKSANSKSKNEPKKTASVKSETTNKKAEQAKKPVESKPNTKPVESKPTVTEKPKPKPTEKSKPKPKEKPKEESKPEPKPEPKKNTIVHSIVLSSSEVPLPPTEMEITDGDTVLQALIQITMANKVHMDYRGGQGATAYIQGMANVYEFDRGQGSGWMYRVNGIFPDRGAGVVPLLGGDRVEWLYTTNLGVDLGANLKPFRR